MSFKRAMFNVGTCASGVNPSVGARLWKRATETAPAAASLGRAEAFAVMCTGLASWCDAASHGEMSMDNPASAFSGTEPSIGAIRETAAALATLLDSDPTMSVFSAPHRARIKGLLVSISRVGLGPHCGECDGTTRVPGPSCTESCACLPCPKCQPKYSV